MRKLSVGIARVLQGARSQSPAAACVQPAASTLTYSPALLSPLLGARASKTTWRRANAYGEKRERRARASRLRRPSGRAPRGGCGKGGDGARRRIVVVAAAAVAAAAAAAAVAVAAGPALVHTRASLLCLHGGAAVFFSSGLVETTRTCRRRVRALVTATRATAAARASYAHTSARVVELAGRRVPRLGVSAVPLAFRGPASRRRRRRQQELSTFGGAAAVGVSRPFESVEAHARSLIDHSEANFFQRARPPI